MATECFRCGDTGHVYADCPQAQAPGTAHGANTRPWCGLCDERTRLLAANADWTVMVRCPDCHPLRGRQLKQHLRCAGCKQVIYAWDHERCGEHQAPGGGTRGAPEETLAAVRQRMGWPPSSAVKP